MNTTPVHLKMWLQSGITLIVYTRRVPVTVTSGYLSYQYLTRADDI